MPQTIQDKIIGPHENLRSALRDWLLCEDLTPSSEQIIRHLDESSIHRNDLIKQCAWWVVMRHVGAKNWRVLKKRHRTETPERYAKYVEVKHYLPYSDTTRKGNLGEILLCEYIFEITHYIPYVHKLTYNPNVEQSMKGDDVLMFNKTNLQTDLIYAESKIRTEPDTYVVPEIVNNLQGNKRFPTSINFVVQVLRNGGQDALADAIEDLQLKVMAGSILVRHVGWLMSCRGETKSKDVLLRTLDALKIQPNANLVFVAVGIDNVQQFVDDVYQRANDIISNGGMI